MLKIDFICWVWIFLMNGIFLSLKIIWLTMGTLIFTPNILSYILLIHTRYARVKILKNYQNKTTIKIPQRL